MINFTSYFITRLTFIIFAGTPATTELDGILFVTTAPGAIMTLSPITIPFPIMRLPLFIVTLFPIIGATPFLSLYPITTSGLIVQFSSILEFPLTVKYNKNPPSSALSCIVITLASSKSLYIFPYI